MVEPELAVCGGFRQFSLFGVFVYQSSRVFAFKQVSVCMLEEPIKICSLFEHLGNPGSRNLKTAKPLFKHPCMLFIQLLYCCLAQSVGQNHMCLRGQKGVKTSLVPKGLQDYPIKLCEVIHTRKRMEYPIH